MTQKEAYCCLSCRDLPPCNAAANNCVECCEDCKNTSECSSSAYFDGSSFFKDYIYTATLFSNYGYFGLLVDANIFGYENYISTYDTSQETPCSKNGSRRFYSDGQTFINFYYSYNGATTTTSEDYSSCGGECPIIITAPSQCANGNAITQTQCSSPEECSGCEYNITCTEGCVPFTVCTTPTIYRASSIYKTGITFKNSVKLYNSLGEDVGNIIGASYNSNNPSRSWSAPACHFFHP